MGKMELNKKNIIVTGGASGFGLGIVEKFIENGARVVIADRNQDLSEKVSKRLGQNVYSVETKNYIQPSTDI